MSPNVFRLVWLNSFVDDLLFMLIYFDLVLPIKPLKLYQFALYQLLLHGVGIGFQKFYCFIKRSFLVYNTFYA
jgi:hypothetical protein